MMRMMRVMRMMRITEVEISKKVEMCRTNSSFEKF